MSARLVYHDGYPMFAPRAVPIRSVGLCALSASQRPHEGDLDHSTGICAPCLARLPSDVRERHSVKRSLRLWWTANGRLVLLAIAALGYLAALLLFGDWWRGVQAVRGW